MSELKIKGHIIEISAIKSGVSEKTGNEWQSRDMVIKEEGQYGSEIKFEGFGDVNVQKLNALKVGDFVDVFFNVKGSVYEGKRYTKLQFWKINKLNQDSTQPETPQPKPKSKTVPQPEAKEPENLNTDYDSDLPF